MSIIVHPEYESLKKRLSELIFEYNELKLRICPNLEHKYVRQFGLLEYELYKKDVELSKLKRKVQLIQIKINNEEKIDISQINQQIEKEFSSYEKNIAKQMKELEKVLNSHYSCLSKDDVKMLKSIYKKCVFALHPDLNNEMNENQLNLFTQINEAFKNGDLKTLESLYLLIPNNQFDDVSDFDRLNELIKYNEDKIQEIKINYPYNKKDLLKDFIKIESYKNELKQLNRQFDDEIQKYKEKIFAMI
ncbi:MAG: hypothetical protein IJ258_00415 [Methanobrevibacter sp.]|uniref:hypothetical protein n=1 Tax=Methanobrevibacter sp. TaxID=66852 RepID=UPI0025F0FDEE|nr:hypothetical protein [Methanobrevibacter sp.]MBQ8016547.1 hypothetical protein [Methanobrevibacter sp.]